MKPAPAAPPPVRRQRNFQNAGERAFAYAKACGIIGRSFVGKRISALGKPNTLAELDRLVFPETQRELTERELLLDLENRILRRTVEHILAHINSYVNPPLLLVRQLRSSEYADLKTCLHHIASGKPAPSSLSDLGRFRTVRFEVYPDLKAMLDGTEFEFILTQDLGEIQSALYDFTRLDTELDLRYYTLLLDSLRSLSDQDRFFAQKILADEISLRNCVWALRLRSYFHKTPKETVDYLMELKMPGSRISLAAEARKLLDFPLDSRSSWKRWRWEKLLNPAEAGESWTIDPRYFQNAASQYVYHLSWRYFRRMPFSVSSGFCYIKLKQFEEDLLTSVAEGLGLGMGGNDVFKLLEVPA